MRLVTVGDLMPGHPEHAPMPPDRCVTEAVQQADLFLLNFEATLGHVSAYEPDRTFLSTSPVHVEAVPRASLNLACLANNHVTDAGPVGVVETHEMLQDQGPMWSGRGSDCKMQYAPAFYGGRTTRSPCSPGPRRVRRRNPRERGHSVAFLAGGALADARVIEAASLPLIRTTC